MPPRHGEETFEAFPVGLQMIYTDANMRGKAQEQYQRPKRIAAVSALSGLPVRTLLRMVHHLMPERAARIENVLNRAHRHQIFASEFRKVYQHLGFSERTFASQVVER